MLAKEIKNGSVVNYKRRAGPDPVDQRPVPLRAWCSDALQVQGTQSRHKTKAGHHAQGARVAGRS